MTVFRYLVPIIPTKEDEEREGEREREAEVEKKDE